VVDADPYSRLVTKATLVEAGFRVAMAGSVSRALQSLLSGVHASVDVVLLVSIVLYVTLFLLLLLVYLLLASNSYLSYFVHDLTAYSRASTSAFSTAYKYCLLQLHY
jgi:hypothetical protein